MINILVGAVALFVFGALWYTVLFGKYWAKLMGFDANDPKMKEGMAKPLIINFIANIVVAYAVFYLEPKFLSISFMEFWKTMLIIWLGFSLPIFVNQTLWEKKPWALVLLNSANGVIATTIISALAYYWPMAV